MSLLHLQIGLCVNPTLNINGCLFSIRPFMTSMEWRSTVPASALRSQSLTSIHLNALHSAIICCRWGCVGGVLGPMVSIVFCFFCSRNSSSGALFKTRLQFSPRVEAVDTEETDSAVVHGNGNSESWAIGLTHEEITSRYFPKTFQYFSGKVAQKSNGYTSIYIEARVRSMTSQKL